MHEMFVTDNLLAITVVLMFIDTITSVDRHQNCKIKTAGVGIRFVKDSHCVGI